MNRYDESKRCEEIELANGSHWWWSTTRPDGEYEIKMEGEDDREFTGGLDFVIGREDEENEHIPSYSVPASSHDLTLSELIKVDPFDDEVEQPPPVVTPIVTEIPLEIPQEIPTNTTTKTPHVSTITQPPPTATQSSIEVVVGPPPSGRPKRNCKSTKRDDFVYSCHSNSFSSFIASDAEKDGRSCTLSMLDSCWGVTPEISKVQIILFQVY
ncbi:gag-pol polyprotein [Artemisia annua]|uniref:Gag-pol polyprotein n=1 Tax=Artemisia annua TaxID=35608 RepID=A0A2U1LNU9_ARTAN|nr:gag-pol polyprotein [Artemisia annua]